MDEQTTHHGANRAHAAQYACLVLSLAWTVAGGVALARLSLASRLDSGGYTELAGVIAIGIGVLLALIGSFAWRDRGMMLLAGGMLIAPGLVLAIVPAAFSSLLGAGAGTGIALVVSGMALAALAPPNSSVTP